MSTVGIFNTSNFAQHEIRPSFQSTIHRKAPNGLAKFTGMMARVGNERISNTHYEWFTSRMSFPQLKFAAQLPSATRLSVTQIAVENSDFVIEKQVYQIRGTDEQVLVLGIVGNTIAIRRGVGSVLPAQVASGTEAFQVGTAFEESSMCPLPIHESSDHARNITQIFRNSWGVSGTTAAVTPEIGPKRDAKSKREMMEYHALDMEMAFMFGQLVETVQGGQPLRKMDGIMNMIRKYAPQNIKYAGTTTSWDQLEAMVDGWFDIVTDQSELNDRVLFVGKRALHVLNKLGRYYYDVQATPAQTSFGMVFTDFKTTRGTFRMVEHPLFNQLGLPDYALAVDLSSKKLHSLGDRDAKYNDIFKDGCVDAVGGTILSELTMSNFAPESDGLIIGLCEATTDVVATPVTTNMACLSVDKPCESGKVASGTVVTLKIVDAKASQAYTIKVSDGTTKTITTDSAGTGTTTFTAGTAPLYMFAVDPTVDGTTLWLTGSVSVCVAQPCDGDQPGVNDSQCVDTQVSVPTPTSGTNTGADVGHED